MPFSVYKSLVMQTTVFKAHFQNFRQELAQHRYVQLRFCNASSCWMWMLQQVHWNKYVQICTAFVWMWNRPEKNDKMNGKATEGPPILKKVICAFAGESEEWPGHISCPLYRDYVYKYAPLSTARKCKQICHRMCFWKTCVYVCEVWM